MSAWRGPTGGAVPADTRISKIASSKTGLQHRLLIDLSEVVTVDYGTGIHRVVRNITRSLLASPRQDWEFIPVAHAPGGQWHSACSYVRETLQVTCAEPPWPPVFTASDSLLMLDSCWQQPERFLATALALQEAAGRVGGLLYDLIPLRHPQYCVDFMPPIFERWLRFLVLHADFIICISRTVADDLHAWILQVQPEMRRDLHIGHIHLGSDIGEGGSGGTASSAMRAAMEAGDAVLMVGTVEPRKRHDLVLDAFEQAWAAGSVLHLVIAGKPGWNVDALVRRIRNHPQAGSKLHWIMDASNADLAHAYARCACLLQASDAEGFGLPIVEAARAGKPLLLSDIAVFREIAGASATYFAAGDAQALAARLMPGSALPDATDEEFTISWNQSADWLLRLLANDGPWDHRLRRSGQ